MSKEADIISKLTTVLGHLHNDANLALDDVWDRSDDGFQSQLYLIDDVLEKVEEYDKELFNEAMKEPRRTMKDMTGE